MTQPALIAVVDDDEAIRTSLSSLLRSAGYDVRLHDSAEAYLGDVSSQPACVVTDFQMPGLNGLELLDRLHAGGAKTPVIIMTAFATDAIRQRARAGGAICFLEKPFEADAILNCLATALGAPGPAAAPPAA